MSVYKNDGSKQINEQFAKGSNESICKQFNTICDMIAICDFKVILKSSNTIMYTADKNSYSFKVETITK